MGFGVVIMLLGLVTEGVGGAIGGLIIAAFTALMWYLAMALLMACMLFYGLGCLMIMLMKNAMTH